MLSLNWGSYGTINNRRFLFWEKFSRDRLCRLFQFHHKYSYTKWKELATILSFLERARECRCLRLHLQFRCHANKVTGHFRHEWICLSENFFFCRRLDMAIREKCKFYEETPAVVVSSNIWWLSAPRNWLIEIKEVSTRISMISLSITSWHRTSKQLLNRGCCRWSLRLLLVHKKSISFVNAEFIVCRQSILFK